LVVNPPRLEPALVAFLCVMLAGLHAAGSVVVLRILTVCRHHLDRMQALEAMEAKFRHAEEKAAARRQKPVEEK